MPVNIRYLYLTYNLDSIKLQCNFSHNQVTRFPLSIYTASKGGCRLYSCTDMYPYFYIYTNLDIYFSLYLYTGGIHLVIVETVEIIFSSYNWHPKNIFIKAADDVFHHVFFCCNQQSKATIVIQWWRWEKKILPHYIYYTEIIN